MSVFGHPRPFVLALVTCFGLGVSAVMAQSDAELAVGQNAWMRAGCENCHGNRGQGGNGGDYPIGPSFRTTALDKDTMALIVSCGLPGTPMPTWLRGAYTEVECYGMPVGSSPSGMSIPRIFTGDEIKALVDYIFATFVQTPQN